MLFKSSHWPLQPCLRLLIGQLRPSNDPSIIYYTTTKWATFDKDIITVQKGLWRVENIKHHDTSHIFHYYFMSGSIAGLQALLHSGLFQCSLKFVRAELVPDCDVLFLVQL